MKFLADYYDGDARVENDDDDDDDYDTKMTNVLFTLLNVFVNRIFELESGIRLPRNRKNHFQ